MAKLKRYNPSISDWEYIESESLASGADKYTASTIKNQFASVDDKFDLVNMEIADIVERKLNQKLLKNNPYSPVHTFFGWTGVNDINPGGTLDTHKVGEPFIVQDGDIYRMFYFGYINSPQEARCLDATAPSILGPWTKRNINLNPNGTLNRHKMVILVDEIGNPVKVNNKYHAYVVGFPQKRIYHWESDSLSGTWVETGEVIGTGLSGNGSDGYGADAPYALWYNNQAILFYMAMPSASQADFGLAHRINRAVSSNPAGSFTYNGVACLPSADSSKWYYGWLGGAQVRMSPEGTWWIALNAASTRPTAAGKEDYPSLWGMAEVENIYGQWKVLDTPRSWLPEQFGVTSLSPQPVEELNVWRPHLQFSKELNCWIAYYNTGGAIEKITHALEGKLYFAYNSDNIQALTTTETKVAKTGFKLTKGYYRINLTLNLMSGGAGETPKIDVVVKGKYNSVALPNHTIAESKYFIGSYQYENTNAVLSFPIFVSDENVDIYFAVQIASGTPTSTSRVRNAKIFVERLKGF